MSEMLNLSSEVHHLVLPNSCIMNSLLIDENSLCSFSSQRAGSVTVTGKRLSSNNLLSPCEENKQKKYPIPIQTLSRIKSQNTQVKKMLDKKSIKSTNNQPISPRVKTKSARLEENNEKLKDEGNKYPFLKHVLREDSPKLQIYAETPGIKNINKAKNNLKRDNKTNFSLKSELKIKNDIKHQLKIDLGKLFTKNKSCKNIGIDVKINSSRSIKNDSNNKKTGKKNKKKYRKDVDCTNDASHSVSRKKIGIEFLKVIKNQLLNHSKSKILSNATEISGLNLNKISSESALKGFTKEKNKKISREKRKKRIENIFFDSKSKKSLERLCKVKSKDDLFNRIHKIKPISKKITSGKVKKLLECTKFEKEATEDKQKSLGNNDIIKKDMQRSGLSFKKKSEAKEKSAILIQSHIRKYLAQQKYKKTKKSYILEDAEVKSIIKTWKKEGISIKTGMQNPVMQEFTEKKLDTQEKFPALQKLKNEEINEIRNIIENCEKDFSMIDIITKIIDNRYKNIEEIMKFNINQKEKSEKKLINFISQGKNFENLLESVKPDDSSEKNWAILNENDINTKANSETPTKYDSKIITDDILTINESSQTQNTINLESNSKGNLEKSKEIINFTLETIDDPKESLKNRKICSESFCKLSEIIIAQILNEEINKYKSIQPEEIKNEEINENFDAYIESTLEFIDARLDKISSVIIKPLRKNPLEILAKMQMPYIINPLRWDFSNFPMIISSEMHNDIISNLHIQNSPYLKSQIKMLLDSCNETLHTFRPHGIFGAPMPWSNSISSYKRKKNHSKTIGKDLKKTIWNFNSLCAGKIPDNSYISSLELNEEKLQNHREEKISTLIASDIRNYENVWINYEYEETQIKLNVADKVFDLLINEALEML